MTDKFNPKDVRFIPLNVRIGDIEGRYSYIDNKKRLKPSKFAYSQLIIHLKGGCK